MDSSRRTFMMIYTSYLISLTRKVHGGTAGWWAAWAAGGTISGCMYAQRVVCFSPLLHVAQNPSFALHIHIWTELFEVSLFNGGLLARRHWVSGHPMTMLRIIDP